MQSALVLLLLLFSTLLTAAESPNLVVILADDLGYGDVACNNPQTGKIKTPHIDALAAQGIRFTDAHTSSGVCSPTRYTLLTGRYHWRTRLQTGIVGVYEKPLIAPERLTLASLAKQRGYVSACIGKWHLGWDWPLDKQTLTQTRALGGKAGGGGKVATEVPDDLRAAWREAFAKPVTGGPITRGFDRYFGTDVPNWPPYCFIENDRTVGIPTELLPAENFAKDLASLQGPALKDWRLDTILASLGERAEAFITEQAQAKKPFLLYLPLTAPHTPIAPGESSRGKSGLGAYADLVMETDAVVGRVLNALKSQGVDRNTLVLLTSDNGFANYIQWNELKAAGHQPSGPLRGFKMSVYEGGNRVPFIVRWPGVVPEGRTCGRLIHQADIFATFAEILNVNYPQTAGEDSLSFLPLLKGSDAPIRQSSVSCGANGQPGLRDGVWKLIPALKIGDNPELYNLEDDIAETKNLAAQEPERVKSMTALLEKTISDGRSTPGEPQKNDVEVVRFPKK